MSLTLSSPVTDVPRVGPAKAKLLAKLGITHARDFLYTLPRRYDDFSQVTPIAELRIGEKKTIRGRVVSTKSVWGFQGRRRVLRIFVDIADDTGTLHVTWYNLRFLVPQLWQGRELYVAGKIEAYRNAPGDPPSPEATVGTRFAVRSPVLEFIAQDGTQTHTAPITPVYPETSGVTSRFLRYQVKTLLPLLQLLPEYLPPDIRKRNRLLDIRTALTTAHFPTSTDALEEAQRRLRFDELFFLQLAALVRRQEQAQASALPIAVPKKSQERFIRSLPFTLTGAQQTAVTEIAADMRRAIPMNRLLQGDVGSGKSAVALIAINNALQAGDSVVYLAPTEILARQQAENFSQVLGGDRVALLIGSLRTNEKQVVKQRLASAEALCVVGTHALLQEDVVVQRLGLAIVDEQHRFGVGQRHALQHLSDSEHLPHLLSMTATPIPRTLTLTVYGDLDVSVLDELPPGRQPVTTTIVPPTEREAAIVHILDELHHGRQAFVIAPLIERAEPVALGPRAAKYEVKSATQAAKEMRELFPDIAIGLLHGQLSSEEKESVIRHFNAGAIQLLVSTAVVEVGINVPNATVMIIEGAERFGLSQLHQFRGRIGRGTQQSYCYLFPTTATAAASPRLRILAQTTDGFKIAEKDLALRGPGEVYGVQQSGFGNLQVASLLDYPLIKLARQEAERILTKDPELKKYPILQKKVRQKNLQNHFE